MKMLLNLNVDVAGAGEGEDDDSVVQTFQKGIDWPVGIIPVPDVGDTLSLTAGLNRSAATETRADVIERIFYPEGLIVKEASVGVVHVVLLLHTDDHGGAVARDALERSGWTVVGA